MFSLMEVFVHGFIFHLDFSEQVFPGLVLSFHQGVLKMADIAMLVAEEYERRVRNSRSKIGAESQEIDLVSCVAVLGQRIKNKIGQERIEVVKLALEPKSQIGVAAFNGAFSA